MKVPYQAIRSSRTYETPFVTASVRVVGGFRKEGEWQKSIPRTDSLSFKSECNYQFSSVNRDTQLYCSNKSLSVFFQPRN